MSIKEPTGDPSSTAGPTASSHNEARKSGWARQAVVIAPPPLCYLTLRFLYSRVAGPTMLDFEAATWARWDSGNYADIAKNGYYIASCASQNRAPHGVLCSPAAWYPAYPYLGRWLSSLTGMSLDHAFVLIAHGAFVGLLYVIWLGLFKGRLTVRSAALLGLAAFFPGSIYFLASFPISLLVLALCLQIYFFTKSRWLIGAVFGALASLCYPIAVVLPITSAIWVFTARHASRHDEPPGRHRLTSPTLMAVAVGGIVSCGTLVVFVLHQVVLGDWAASYHEQQKFGGTLFNPGFNWVHTVIKQNSWIQATYPETARVIAAQTLLVTLLMLTCVIVVAFVKKGRTAHDLGLLFMLLGLWLLPLSGNIETGLYRRVTPLVPTVYLLRRAAWPVTLSLTIASAGVWWWMVPKFASGALI